MSQTSPAPIARTRFLVLAAFGVVALLAVAIGLARGEENVLVAMRMLPDASR